MEKEDMGECSSTGSGKLCFLTELAGLLNHLVDKHGDEEGVHEIAALVAATGMVISDSPDRVNEANEALLEVCINSVREIAPQLSEAVKERISNVISSRLGVEVPVVNDLLADLYGVNNQNIEVKKQPNVFLPTVVSD